MNCLGKIKSLVTLAVAGTLLAMAGGCEQGNVQMIEVASGRAVGTPATIKAAEAPKPAAPAKAAEPAPKAAAAPAPASSGSGCGPTPAGYGSSELAFPTGDRASSAIMLTQMQPFQVRAGQAFDSMICVTNLTAGTLQNVVVKNESLNNLKIQSSTPAGTAAGDTMIWALGTLGPRESKLIKISGIASAVGAAGNCLSVAYANTLCTNLQVVQPALAITKTITPQSILGCDPIVASIEVKNTGSGDATNVVVTDSPDAGLTFASGGPTFNVGTLKAGESRKIDVAFKASKTGTFNNVASATADGIPAVSSQRVTTKVVQPVLTIACKSPERVFLGRDVTYEFTVKNTGDAACDGTVVTASLPAGAANVRMSDGGANGSWSLGSLAAGATKTVTVTFKPTAGAGGSVKVSASASCKCAAAVTTECSTNIFGLPDIGTLVTDDDGVVEVGNNHTYRVEVKNQGQIPLTNTKMVVTLPEGLTFVSSADGRAVGNKVEFNFGTLAPGAIKASNFIVKASKSGELLVVGETTCAEIKTPIRDDELTNFVDR